MVIGTHALISETVAFQNLGLVITDEQHRFGVAQRSLLAEKGNHPHMLVMSATPIPRTLALIIYGDLDISVLDELPPGRQTIETYAISSRKRARALQYIRTHLDAGQQRILSVLWWKKVPTIWPVWYSMQTLCKRKHFRTK